ncbi:hypothetical protein [uncultured Methanobrevibacter sp.]|uniref:hypothetical protein n=1 Tax=uncultured Methanobrevibacter sp. TaxID=253161 RepID=UPI002635F24C|nr:hypothetical protein [uncultured Methanobrevibacter sp.]
MSFKKKFSLAIVDVEKIDEINKIIIKYGFDLQQYSSHIYFNLAPIDADHIYKDISFFQLESENELGLNKKLDDLIEEINQLNTQFAIREEETHEMIVEINQVMAIYIKFDNVKFIKEGTYEKIDAMDHLKTEFGICKTYNPNFRPLENRSIENTVVEPEIVYLFADSEENLSKLKEDICEKIMEIDSDFELEFKPFRFID